MKIELWSDVICPWCGIGSHRLDEALARFAHGSEVEVVRRSFQLDESAPAGSAETVRDALRRRYGMDAGQLDATFRRVEALATADGLVPYLVGENRTGNTGLAHELLALASERGRADEAWKRLYRAYFGEARDIFAVKPLVQLGVEIGLDADEVRDALTSRRYASRVAADALEARQLGSTGVPFFVFDRRYAVSGAQPIEVLVGAIERAWAESHSVPTPAQPPLRG